MTAPLPLREAAFSSRGHRTCYSAPDNLVIKIASVTWGAASSWRDITAAITWGVTPLVMSLHPVLGKRQPVVTASHPRLDAVQPYVMISTHPLLWTWRPHHPRGAVTKCDTYTYEQPTVPLTITTAHHVMTPLPTSGPPQHSHTPAPISFHWCSSAGACVNPYTRKSRPNFVSCRTALLSSSPLRLYSRREFLLLPPAPIPCTSTGRTWGSRQVSHGPQSPPPSPSTKLPVV